MEPRFGGWPSLEDWDNYLTMEEENLELYKQLFEESLEQRKRQFEEKCRLVWAELAEDLVRRRRFEQQIEERWSKLEKRKLQLAEEMMQTDKKEEEDRARLDQKKAELDRREEEIDRQKRELKIQVEALNKFLAMEKEQLQKPLLVQRDNNNNMPLFPCFLASPRAPDGRFSGGVLRRQVAARRDELQRAGGGEWRQVAVGGDEQR